MTFAYIAVISLYLFSLFDVASLKRIFEQSDAQVEAFIITLKEFVQAKTNEYVGISLSCTVNQCAYAVMFIGIYRNFCFILVQISSTDVLSDSLFVPLRNAFALVAFVSKLRVSH